MSKAINAVILKIRDFIIGFRFKKYGHFKTRLDKFKTYIPFAIRQLIRQSLCAMIAGAGAAQVAAIQQTPIIKTKEEQQKKKLAIVNSIINTNLAIIKAYAKY